MRHLRDELFQEAQRAARSERTSNYSVTAVNQEQQYSTDDQIKARKCSCTATNHAKNQVKKFSRSLKVIPKIQELSMEKWSWTRIHFSRRCKQARLPLTQTKSWKTSTCLQRILTRCRSGRESMREGARIGTKKRLIDFMKL